MADFFCLCLRFWQAAIMKCLASLGNFLEDKSEKKCNRNIIPGWKEREEEWKHWTDPGHGRIYGVWIEGESMRDRQKEIEKYQQGKELRSRERDEGSRALSHYLVWLIWIDNRSVDQSQTHNELLLKSFVQNEHWHQSHVKLLSTGIKRRSKYSW